MSERVSVYEWGCACELQIYTIINAVANEFLAKPRMRSSCIVFGVRMASEYANAFLIISGREIFPFLLHGIYI